jgi:hypothetical protein
MVARSVATVTGLSACRRSACRYFVSMGTREGVTIATIMTNHICVNIQLAPDQLWPGIFIPPDIERHSPIVATTLLRNAPALSA